MDDRMLMFHPDESLSDLRDGDRERIGEVLKSMAPFTVDISVGFSISGAHIAREEWDDEVTVYAWVEIDEYGVESDYALITDALWALGYRDTELTEQELAEIADRLDYLDILSDYAETISLPADVDQDGVMEALDRLDKELNGAADESFDRVKAIVRDHMEKREED